MKVANPTLKLIQNKLPKAERSRLTYIGKVIPWVFGAIGALGASSQAGVVAFWVNRFWAGDSVFGTILNYASIGVVSPWLLTYAPFLGFTAGAAAGKAVVAFTLFLAKKRN